MNSSPRISSHKRLDGFDLREEAMAADIEPEPLVLSRARNAADDVVRFEDGDANTLLREQIGGGQPRRSRANNDDMLSGE